WVGELVGGDAPVPGLQQDLLRGMTRQAVRAEQAQARGLEPPHLRELLSGPVGLEAVEAHGTSRWSSRKESAIAGPEAVPSCLPRRSKPASQPAGMTVSPSMT